MASDYSRKPAPIRSVSPRSPAFTVPKAKQASMFYSILPTIVKSRIPRLPSPRRSGPVYNSTMANRRKPDSSFSRPSSTGSSTAVDSGASTPDIGYAASVVQDEGIGEEYYTEREASGYTQREIGDRQILELGDCKSGIAWKFANQGLRLVDLAATESTSILRDSTYGNAAFARQLYIHSLTYLLRGLPADLTPDEQLSLRSALPIGLVQPSHFDSSALHSSQSTSTPRPAHEPSLLHRILASTIVQLFVFFQLCMPYIKAFLSLAYTYDREHKITERVFSQGVTTLDTMGKRGIEITERVCKIGDGKIGEVLGRTVRWVVEGVAGGVHEGLGEGLMILGAIGKS